VLSVDGTGTGNLGREECTWSVRVDSLFVASCDIHSYYI
jgi:hypothetical protein